MKQGPVRFWDWSCAAFLVVAQLVVCQRLAVTNWTTGLMLPVLITLLGVTIGLALGISQFSDGLAALLAFAYGSVLILLIGGGILSGDTVWLEKMAGLGARLAASFGLFLARRPVEDPILFLAFVTIAFWIISLEAGYSLTRSGNFAGAVLPGGVVLFIIQLYNPGSPARLTFLGAYFFLGLLLLARLAYIRRRQFWKEHRIWVSSESATEFNIVILVVPMLLVLLTWVIPVSAQPFLEAKTVWDKVTQPLQQTRRDLGNAVAGLSGSPPPAGTSDFYGDQLALGRQASGDATVLFTVHVSPYLDVARNYWRVRTYDHYENGEWQTGPIYGEGVNPAQPIGSADAQGLPTVNYIFNTPQAILGILVTPTRPVSINHATTLSYFPLAGGEIEPILFRVNPPILAGEQYEVQAAISNPTIVQLASAGNVYPSWVTDRYLQLPSDFPAAITALAVKITAGADTPYAKTEAITQYLRDTIRYTKSVPPAPPGEDTLTWFLLDYKAGFCNYYASAEVVMLRAVGIPARLAVGYAQGRFQRPDLRIVRQEDAHAWPEVYFPGSGWVEFEPTASQAPLDRPSGEPAATREPHGPGRILGLGQAPANGGNPLPAGETGSASGAIINGLLRVIVPVLLLAILVAGSGLAIRRSAGGQGGLRLPPGFQTPLPVLLLTGWKEIGLTPPRWLERWARNARLTPMERAFGTVYRSLRSLGGQTTPAQTAAEAAAQLIDRLPGAARDIQALLVEYQRAQYGRTYGNLWVARRATESLHRQALRAVLRRRLAPLERVFRKKQ